MTFASRNPADNTLLERFELLPDAELDCALEQAAQAAACWRSTSFAERGALLVRMAELIEQRREQLALLAHEEMGKLLAEALGEVDKCAVACRHYAEHAEGMLQDELIETAASRSLVSYEPLGAVLAIMPWNFPYWQVFRFLAPTLMAGNSALLKHAPNVPRCAAAMAQLALDAGAPAGLFTNLFIDNEQSAKVIADPRVHGVAFTGSERAGRQIGALAGANLKKVVLELGGSDPFIVLEDADLDQAVDVAVRARYSNAGQICIAAKRFIVVDAVAREFTDKLVARVQALQPGESLAPMARADLRDELHRQVEESISEGAVPLLGCKPVDGDGFYYAASVLDNVQLGMTAFDEEMFGPVAGIVRARDEQDAVALANATRFGLGASIWTADTEKGEQMARQIEAGAVFVNAQVASDVRMPFGGIKASGLGRELGEHGIREFCNVKSIWVA